MFDFKYTEYKSYYFIGIGGVSMSSLAHILKHQGYTVGGFDRARSDATDFLADAGINIHYDYKPEYLDGVDVVVFTAAIPDSDITLTAARARDILCIGRSVLLGALAANYTRSVGVAGTHGKSTVSGMLSEIFLSADGGDPTILIGATLPSINSSYRLGNDSDFIFEACEYKASFLDFYPKTAVILNVELDHTDYYPNIEKMTESFSKYLANTGKDGIAIVNADSEHAMLAAKGYCGKLYTYSANQNIPADFTAGNISYEKGFGRFDAYYRGEKLFCIKLSVPGEHNISNALAAIAAAYLHNIPSKAIINGLNGFHGVGRRFEYKGSLNGASVYDDYAHHPDEIRATLRAAAGIPHRRIAVVFQPHTYCRLHDFFDGFADALSNADVLILADVFVARESNIYNQSSADLQKAIDGSLYIPDFKDIADYLKKNIQPDDILIIMGAGNINELTPLLV